MSSYAPWPGFLQDGSKARPRSPRLWRMRAQPPSARTGAPRLAFRCTPRATMATRRSQSQRSLASTAPTGRCAPTVLGNVRSQSLPQPVRVLTISQVEAGWIAHGRVKTGYCDLCGSAYRILAQYVPIECAEYPCPRCNEDELKCDIVSITYTGGLSDYAFEARLTCPKCGTTTAPRRILCNKPLRWLRRVIIGPSGIEVQSHESSAS